MSWRERPTVLVAERELREATRARSFRISVVISAAALAAVIVIANLAGGDERSVDVVVAGPNAAEMEPALARLGDAVGIRFDTTTAPDDDAARAAVDDGDADVAVLTDGRGLVTEEPVDLS